MSFGWFEAQIAFLCHTFFFDEFSVWSFLTLHNLVQSIKEGCLIICNSVRFYRMNRFMSMPETLWSSCTWGLSICRWLMVAHVLASCTRLLVPHRISEHLWFLKDCPWLRLLVSARSWAWSKPHWQGWRGSHLTPGFGSGPHKLCKFSIN